jgi:hypothetical protein
METEGEQKLCGGGCAGVGVGFKQAWVLLREYKRRKRTKKGEIICKGVTLRMDFSSKLGVRERK